MRKRDAVLGAAALTALGTAGAMKLNDILFRPLVPPPCPRRNRYTPLYRRSKVRPALLPPVGESAAAHEDAALFHETETFEFYHSISYRLGRLFTAPLRKCLTLASRTKRVERNR